MMTATELLSRLREAGFTIRIEGSALHVLQARWIDDELADLIRSNKTDLMEILKSEKRP